MGFHIISNSLFSYHVYNLENHLYIISNDKGVFLSYFISSAHFTKIIWSGFISFQMTQVFLILLFMSSQMIHPAWTTNWENLVWIYWHHKKWLWKPLGKYGIVKSDFENLWENLRICRRVEIKWPTPHWKMLMMIYKKKYQKNTIDDIKELRSLVKTGLIKDWQGNLYLHWCW